MSAEHTGSEYAVRVSGNGFAFAVRHLFAPILETSQALVAGMQARAKRRQGLREISELPDYLRQDIGMKP